MLISHKLVAIVVLSAICFSLKPDEINLIPPPGRMRALPARTLWVWERPEDLSKINPHTTAIATLDRTILIGSTVKVAPRRQSYIFPAGATRIAVVRIEAAGPTDTVLEPATAAAILEVAA